MLLTVSGIGAINNYCPLTVPESGSIQRNTCSKRDQSTPRYQSPCYVTPKGLQICREIKYVVSHRSSPNFVPQSGD